MDGMRRLILMLVVALPAWSALANEAAVIVRPPLQPEAGPGGLDYLFEGVRVTRYGEGADGYWLFEPRDAGEEARPVVMYAHGLNAIHYGATWLWIKHMVRKGNIVIYPQYQGVGIIDPLTFTDKSAAATRDALDKLDGDEHLLADTKRFAMVGHSLGGTIIVNLAARYEHYGLPRPKALMPVTPGDVRADSGLGALLPKITEDHSTVHADTLMLIVTVETDRIVGQSFARRIYRNTRNIDAANKNLLVLGSDDHGRPSLDATHFVPAAYRDREGHERADAYDFAMWRWFDALSDAAFYDDRHREFALGGTRQQLVIGKWSDGTPVREPRVIAEP